MLIDIHTHRILNSKHWVIQNLYKEFEQAENPGNYSIGLHPWFIEEKNWTFQFNILKKYAQNNFVVALGECGLDKKCDTDFLLQKEVFEAHVILANFIQKPLIIHCVKAYEEIKEILKVNKNNVPVIFHGFNKKEHIAQSLVKEGFFLSFGKSISKENIKILLGKIPLDNIFFETDDDIITIEEIYSTAAKILSVDKETLQLQIKKNAIRIFGDGLF